MPQTYVQPHFIVERANQYAQANELSNLVDLINTCEYNQGLDYALANYKQPLEYACKLARYMLVLRYGPERHPRLAPAYKRASNHR